MTLLRKAAAIVLIAISGAGIIVAGWTGIKFHVPEQTAFFEDADKIHKSLYTDETIDTLLEQNLRMQEAIFSAQKQGIQSILLQQQSINQLTHRFTLMIAVLLTGSIFCLVLGILIFPREIRLSGHSLAQLEMIIWHSMVVDKNKDMNDEFTLKQSAYPVHLCGCSSGDLPVHLCGCGQAAVPVHLCKCG